MPTTQPTFWDEKGEIAYAAVPEYQAPFVAHSETSKQAADELDEDAAERIRNRVIEFFLKADGVPKSDEILNEAFPEIRAGDIRESTPRARRVEATDFNVPPSTKVSEGKCIVDSGVKVKNKSGKSATGWIHKFFMAGCVALLLLSGCTITRVGVTYKNVNLDLQVEQSK